MQSDSDFEVIEDEDWEGPEPVALPDMTWANNQGWDIISHHLYKHREHVQRPTRRVQELISTDAFRKGIRWVHDQLDEMPDWEREQFWVWRMPIHYTSTMKQLDQYLAWLRQGGVVNSYHGHMAATALHAVCRDIVRHRRRVGA